MIYKNIKIFFLFALFFLSFSSASADIGFGNSTIQTTTSFSYTNDEDFLLVFTSSYQVSETCNPVTGVTYNGVSLVSAGTPQLARSRCHQAWYLASPSIGSYTLTVSGGSISVISASVVSVSGVDLSSPINAYNTASASGVASISITTTEDNSYVVSGGVVENVVTAGANTTKMQGSSYYGLWRSTSAVSPSGSFSINVASDSGAYGLVAVSLSPSVEEPVYGCTDPEANNYDPDATDDDSSCTYEGGGIDFVPVYSIPFQQFINASSTCTQTNEGTTTPVTFYCTATSTTLDQPSFSDWLFVISIVIFIMSFMLWGILWSPFKRKN